MNQPTPIEPHSRSVRARQARIYSAAAESATLADRIKVSRDQGRIKVTILRRYERVFYLGDDECSYLSGLLAAQVAPVIVTRVEDRKAAGQ